MGFIPAPGTVSLPGDWGQHSFLGTGKSMGFIPASGAFPLPGA